jgi:tetratricopeptide (TPR) repeat protein
MRSAQTIKTNYFQQFWICAALTLITVAVFYEVCTYDFVDYDDILYVTGNPNIQAGITPKTIKWAFTTDYACFWHPLTWLSYLLDWQLFGSKPAGYHLTNLIFHVVNTVLMFIVLTQMTHRVWPSAFVAAMFALHPLHVESVAWIAERKDVLSTFFWMLTMWAYLRYVKRPGVTRYLLTLLTFALGLMAKPMLVTLPVVLLLLDYWPLARTLQDQEKKHTDTCFHRLYPLILEKIPFIVLSVVFSVITFLAEQSGEAIAPLTVSSIKPRIYNALISYVKYIEKMIWPSRLAVFYPHPEQNIPILYAMLSAVLLLAVTILILRFARNHRYLVTGWFWYLGTLVPVIGLIRVGFFAMADRYTYVTLTGLFIIIAWGLPDLLAGWRYKKIALTLSALLIILAMSICTFFQLRHWQNGLTLFQHALDVTGESYLTRSRIAASLQKQGRLDEAIYHYKRALRLNPNIVEIYLSLGDALRAKGEFAEAIFLYNKALRIAPNLIELHNNLALTLMASGKLAEAAKEYEKILRIQPQNITAQINLGRILCHQGRFDEAAVHLAESLRLDPNSAMAHYYLGQVLTQKGKLPEAITHFEESLRLKPDWVEPMNALAWFLATSKEPTIYNPSRAVRLAQRACGLTSYKEPYFLDTLAAAYAATGDFNKAVETAEKALELCQPSFKEEFENRLALYKAGKPYVGD